MPKTMPTTRNATPAIGSPPAPLPHGAEVEHAFRQAEFEFERLRIGMKRKLINKALPAIAM
jgi:hypothetical protein